MSKKIPVGIKINISSAYLRSGCHKIQTSSNFYYTNKSKRIITEQMILWYVHFHDLIKWTGNILIENMSC